MHIQVLKCIRCSMFSFIAGACSTVVCFCSTDLSACHAHVYIEAFPPKAPKCHCSGRGFAGGGGGVGPVTRPAPGPFPGVPSMGQVVLLPSARRGRSEKGSFSPPFRWTNCFPSSQKQIGANFWSRTREPFLPKPLPPPLDGSRHVSPKNRGRHAKGHSPPSVQGTAFVGKSP